MLRVNTLGAGNCRLDIVVISEVIKEHDLWAYPYNALRNQALSRATTDVSVTFPPLPFCIMFSRLPFLHVNILKTIKIYPGQLRRRRQ